MIDSRKTAWQDDALCRQVDPDSFYPDNEDGGMHENSRALFTLAKKLCRGCPVRAECLSLAYESEGLDRGYGVWGGYGPAERVALSKTLKNKTIDELRVWISENDNRRLV